MNEAEFELNIFFNSCADQVKSNKKYVQQFIPLSDRDIAKLKTVQPDFDISELTRIIAEKAGYYRKVVKTNKGNTEQSFYTEQFDSVLSSLWFCFYRFLFFKKLCRAEYGEIALHVTYNTFLRLMKYIDLSIINSGKQITTMLNLILHSNLTNEFQNKKKIQKFFQEEQLSYDDALKGMTDDGGIDDSMFEQKFKNTDSKKTLNYAVEYLITQLPNEYGLHSELTELVNRQRKELSDPSKQIVAKFMKDNNLDFESAVWQAIESHVDYIQEDLLS